MQFHTYKNTDVTVSEAGLGMWTISTGCLSGGACHRRPRIFRAFEL